MNSLENDSQFDSINSRVWLISEQKNHKSLTVLFGHYSRKQTRVNSELYYSIFIDCLGIHWFNWKLTWRWLILHWLGLESLENGWIVIQWGEKRAAKSCKHSDINTQLLLSYSRATLIEIKYDENTRARNFTKSFLPNFDLDEKSLFVFTIDSIDKKPKQHDAMHHYTPLYNIKHTQHIIHSNNNEPFVFFSKGSESFQTPPYLTRSNSSAQGLPTSSISQPYSNRTTNSAFESSHFETNETEIILWKYLHTQKLGPVKKCTFDP